jgi:CRP-like cAMP-binding protein
MRGGERPSIRKLRAGSLLTTQGEPGHDVYLLLDGVLEVSVDEKGLGELGPGAVVGERAVLEGGRRTSSLRAVTKCTVAVAAESQIDREKLMTLAEAHHRED